MPARTVLSEGAIVAAPAWVVRPEPGVPSVIDGWTGQPLRTIPELFVQTNTSLLVLRIEGGDNFVAQIGTDSVQSVNLIDAIISEQSEPQGWTAVIGKEMSYRARPALDQSLPTITTCAASPR